MHLPDLIAYAGHIEFLRLEMALNKFRNEAEHVHHFGKDFRIELVEIFDAFIDFGNQNEPGKKRIVLQEDSASKKFPEIVAAVCKTWVKFEVHAPTNSRNTVGCNSGSDERTPLEELNHAE